MDMEGRTQKTPHQSRALWKIPGLILVLTRPTETPFTSTATMAGGEWIKHCFLLQSRHPETWKPLQRILGINYEFPSSSVVSSMSNHILQSHESSCPMLVKCNSGHDCRKQVHKYQTLSSHAWLQYQIKLPSIFRWCMFFTRSSEGLRMSWGQLLLVRAYLPWRCSLRIRFILFNKWDTQVSTLLWYLKNVLIIIVDANINNRNYTNLARSSTKQLLLLEMRRKKNVFLKGQLIMAHLCDITYDPER